MVAPPFLRPGPPPFLLDGEQSGSRLHRIARPNPDARDAPVLRSRELVLHLHGFDHDHALARPHRLALPRGAAVAGTARPACVAHHGDLARSSVDRQEVENAVPAPLDLACLSVQAYGEAATPTRRHLDPELPLADAGDVTHRSDSSRHPAVIHACVRLRARVSICARRPAVTQGLRPTPFSCDTGRRTSSVARTAAAIAATSASGPTSRKAAESRGKARSRKPMSRRPATKSVSAISARSNGSVVRIPAIRNSSRARRMRAIACIRSGPQAINLAMSA